jgi:hypothetical protein
MPLAQIWKKRRVSSPYILESVECNMCERQNKIRDAYDRICTKQRKVSWLGSTGQTGAPDRSDRSGPASSLNWAAPVRPVPLTGQTGQVQSAHKATEVRAIWSKVIMPGLQAGLDHLAPFSQHKQTPFKACITIYQ